MTWTLFALRFTRVAAEEPLPAVLIGAVELGDGVGEEFEICDPNLLWTASAPSEAACAAVFGDDSEDGVPCLLAAMTQEMTQDRNRQRDVQRLICKWEVTAKSAGSVELRRRGTATDDILDNAPGAAEDGPSAPGAAEDAPVTTGSITSTTKTEGRDPLLYRRSADARWEFRSRSRDSEDEALDEIAKMLREAVLRVLESASSTRRQATWRETSNYGYLKEPPRASCATM